jgi:hypothetical protein
LPRLSRLLTRRVVGRFQASNVAAGGLTATLES